MSVQGKLLEWLCPRPECCVERVLSWTSVIRTYSWAARLLNLEAYISRLLLHRLSGVYSTLTFYSILQYAVERFQAESSCVVVLMISRSGHSKPLQSSTFYSGALFKNVQHILLQGNGD
jgi:hypothetical protein